MALQQPDVKETLVKSMGDALWRFGAVRVQPLLGIRNLGYVSNISGDPSHRIDDYTATGVIGLKAYVPMGPKVILAAHVIPEYVLWQKTKGLNGWQYRYGGGLFGYFNRLTLEAKYTGEDQQQYVSNELESPANITKGLGEVNFGVRVSGPISVFGGGQATNWKYDDNGFKSFFPTQLDNLDRDETSLHGGLKYTRNNGFALGLGYQTNTTNFKHTLRDRSNQGGGPMLTVHHVGDRWDADIDAAYLKLTQHDTGTFREFKSLSGGGHLGLKVGGRTTVAIYGSQGLFYTLAANSEYADETREGLSAQILLGWRTQFRAYIEQGQAKYRSSVASLDDRRLDDFNTFGVEGQFKFGETATLRLGYNHTVYNSNLDQFDRTINNIQVSLNFGGLLRAW
ncbi:MAG: hypothetical protein ABI609_13240 [Acidobacteriota bacterium]